ncbi:Transcription factor HHO5 [Bienertia sinuspersici]
MVSELPGLSLDLRPPMPPISSSFPEFVTRFLVTKINDSKDISKLNDFILSLEDELKKIQAFQRELPLSFLLLNDAISKLKEMVKKNEEKGRDRKSDGSVGVKLGIEECDKKSWMSSAQLWSPSSEESKNEERGANMSFTDDVPGLSLVPPGMKSTAVDEPIGGLFYNSVYSTAVDQKIKPHTRLSYQTARKRRRCWSPDLHRRFVDALEKLGGSQVATPKQIRELMQVDGLTNDEVKSHLQKYRLHVRKLPGATELSTDIATNSGDQLELGYSMMELEHSSSPKGPLHSEMSRKCNSSSMEEDEEEKSDGHSEKVQYQT